MAGELLYNDIASALASWFQPRVVTQFNRACPEAAYITARKGTGKNVQWDVKFPSAVSLNGVFTDGAAITQFRSDRRVPAILQYANYHEPFGVSGRARASALAAGNPEDLVDLYGDEIRDAVTRLAVNFMDGVYNGDGTADHLHGFYCVGAPALGDSGSYATIDPATYTTWKGNVTDAGGDAIGLKHLRSIRRKCRDATGMSPDLYITDTAQFDALATVYDSNRRWVDEVTRADGAKVRIDGGTEELSWEGARIIWSRAHPANKVSAINRNHVYFAQLPDGPDAINRALGSTAIHGTADEQSGEPKFQLQAIIQPLAQLGNVSPFALFMYPALVSERRNASGYITNLATPAT
jgi:hypothetical protein